MSALAGISLASAQETATEPVVIGRIVDAEGGDPVAGVRVHLEQSGLSWITASDGRFRFVVPAPGTDRLTLSGHEITTRSLDPWLSKIQHPGFENSHQKFEWNCGQEESPNLYKKIIQFRPSGIRVKQPTYSPALVLTTTQIPILPWIKVGDNETGRYMTIQEGANLQGMGELKEFPRTIAKAFQAFGNAVNVDVVEKIADNLLVKTTYNNE